MNHRLLALSLLALGTAAVVSPARADTAVGLTAGTLGAGLELQFGLTDTLNARLGYSAYNYSQSVHDTQADYNGKLKLGNGLALLDWHPGGHSFKLTVGAVATSNGIDLVGVPTAGNFVLGNTTFTASQVGSVQGTLKTGSSVAPYAGLGFGNAVGKGGHFSFLFDLGVIFTGSPKVTLTATCNAAVPAATCTQIQQAALVEIADLQKNATQLKVWPVLSLGVGYRF